VGIFEVGSVLFAQSLLSIPIGSLFWLDILTSSHPDPLANIKIQIYFLEINTDTHNPATTALVERQPHASGWVTVTTNDADTTMAMLLPLPGGDESTEDKGNEAVKEEEKEEEEEGKELDDN
jgi:hypothetical protein